MKIFSHTLLSLLLLIGFVSCKKISFPVIEIHVDTIIPWDHKVNCNIVESNGYNVDQFSARIKARGGFSSKFPKHSYSLKLSSNTKLLGLSFDDDYILNANYIDKTFLRHTFSYKLFKLFNEVNESPNCAYTELYINDEYKGLYVLMERMDASSLGLDKDDTMAMVFKDPVVFMHDLPSEVQEPNNYFQQKVPKISKSDKSDYLLQFRDFILSSSDEEFEKNIHLWVDVENIIDWHILLLLTNNQDGVVKNFYWYKQNQDTPFRIAIWDYDHAWGRDGDNELNMMRTRLDWHRNILLKRLDEVKGIEYRKQLYTRYFELRKEGKISKSKFYHLMDEEIDQFKDQLLRNFEKWPVNVDHYYDDNGFEAEIDLMKHFIEMRIEYLDAYMNGDFLSFY